MEMEYLLSELAEGVYVIAVKDTFSWDVMSYTNCYVLKRKEQTILIDAGCLAYQQVIIESLEKISIAPEQVTQVLLTHGHQDHVEGAALFKKAQKFVHSADRAMLPAPLIDEFAPYTQGNRPYTFSVPGVSKLEVVFVNTHSPGSVAIYDQVSRALFVGDFFCYFGEELPAGELVTTSEWIKQGSCEYVAGQAAVSEPGLDKFMLGLSRLLDFQPEFFCTGHGVIVKKDIQDFLGRMWQSGRGK